MRFIFYSVLAILTVYASVLWGAFGVFLVGIPCAAIGFATARLFDSYEHTQLLKAYARMLENIYVFSEHENDRTVRTRAEMERTLLRESGNRANCTVHTLYYQDAGHTCETWEEFEARVLEFIKTDREKRLSYINSLDRSFFETEILGQE